MSGSAQCDLVIDQGADFFVELYWTDYNNVPISVQAPMRMEIRSKTGQLAAELIYSGDTPEGQLATAITFNADSGLIQLSLTGAETTNIAPGIYNYDLFVTYADAQSNASLRRQKLLWGSVEVRGKVTQNV